jgi:hypothetical protein
MVRLNSISVPCPVHFETFILFEPNFQSEIDGKAPTQFHTALINGIIWPKEMDFTTLAAFIQIGPIATIQQSVGSSSDDLLPDQNCVPAHLLSFSGDSSALDYHCHR